MHWFCVRLRASAYCHDGGVWSNWGSSQQRTTPNVHVQRMRGGSQVHGQQSGTSGLAAAASVVVDALAGFRCMSWLQRPRQRMQCDALVPNVFRRRCRPHRGNAIHTAPAIYRFVPEPTTTTRRRATPPILRLRNALDERIRHNKLKRRWRLHSTLSNEYYAANRLTLRYMGCCVLLRRTTRQCCDCKGVCTRHTIVRPASSIKYH